MRDAPGPTFVWKPWLFKNSKRNSDKPHHDSWDWEDVKSLLSIQYNPKLVREAIRRAQELEHKATGQFPDNTITNERLVAVIAKLLEVVREMCSHEDVYFEEHTKDVRPMSSTPDTDISDNHVTPVPKEYSMQFARDFIDIYRDAMDRLGQE